MTDLVVPEGTKERISRVLGPARPLLESDFEGITHFKRFDMGSEFSSVQAVVHFMLVEVLGIAGEGRSEKVAWQIPLLLNGRVVVISFEKFGLRLVLGSHNEADQDEENSMAMRIYAQVKKGIAILERDVLRGFASAQLSDGNVLIINQYGALRERYLYFRERARLSFSGEHLLPAADPATPENLAVVRNFMKSTTEGASNAIAAVNSFFSCLEHSLVLFMPLVARSRNRQVDTFIRGRWADKFKAVFDVAGDDSRNQQLGNLHEIAEEWRNVYAHGGFDKAGGGVHIFMPAVGVVPARLSSQTFDPQLAFMPVGPQDFEQLCCALDEFETWLSVESSAMRALTFVRAGLDVSYDSQSKLRYAEHFDGDDDDAFASFIDRRAYMADMYANMDW